MAIAENNKTLRDSKLPGRAILLRPMLIPATHIETFIHFRKVRSLAKKSLGSTFLAFSALNLACFGRLLPKTLNKNLDNGFGCAVTGLGGSLGDCFSMDMPLTRFLLTGLGRNSSSWDPSALSSMTRTDSERPGLCVTK